MQNFATLATLAASASAVLLTSSSTSSTEPVPDAYFFDNWMTLTDLMREKGFTSTFQTTDDTKAKNYINDIGMKFQNKDIIQLDGLAERKELINICRTKGMSVVDSESFADNALAQYDADSDGKLAYHEFMRAWRAHDLGIDEPWTVWPTKEKSIQRVLTAMLYGNITDLTQTPRSLGFTSVYDDLATSDPLRVMMKTWASKIAKATPNGLVDATQIEKAVKGAFGDQFVNFAMSKDADGDGRLTYAEMMQAIRAQETGVDEPWTIWPGTSIGREFHEAMILIAQTPSTPATPPFSNAPTCELTDGLRGIGYSRTYNDATQAEQQALSDLIRTVDQVDIDEDGLLDLVELTDFISVMLLSDPTTGTVTTPEQLIDDYDQDDDEKLNFRDLVFVFDDMLGPALKEIWPCADHLPLRFRAIPEVGGPVHNPVHCFSYIHPSE